MHPQQNKKTKGGVEHGQAQPANAAIYERRRKDGVLSEINLRKKKSCRENFFYIRVVTLCLAVRAQQRKPRHRRPVLPAEDPVREAVKKMSE